MEMVKSCWIGFKYIFKDGSHGMDRLDVGVRERH